MIREWFNVHKLELAVMAAGIGVSFAIALSLTGNFHDALAKASRR